MSRFTTPKSLDLVVNWHVTEACNYRCAYCYAQWDRPDQKEIIRDRNATDHLILALSKELGPAADPSVRPAPARRLRLNFAGGEPLLFADRVLEAMRRARELGLDVSIITNGSRLTRALVAEMAPLMTILGISLDAADSGANEAIGRVDARGRTLSVQEIGSLVALARTLNPSLSVKVNTVVNAGNWNLDLTQLTHQVAPDQWKVLRMLPSTTTNLQVRTEQFQAFLSRHAHLKHLMRVEDNDDMVGSYLMIDPHGRFFQNGQTGFGYSYSAPILGKGAGTALKAVQWSPEKFAARYGHRPIKEQQ